ncbi:TonB-dependent receptor [Ferrimonas sp. YFM]|uniref:TonB-dependent receptor n=1 Tax=Ferrimonas sp. YFM TaxID=3028878 RepID=UPI002573C16F|nr:TonB-dependent receptor [Ferrimonas sp. YFM]BDY04786.1 TonB-dependent receptor [Ferrimonas sp. YFM]
MRTKLSIVALAVSCSIQAQEIETITVNADFRDADIARLPTSVTVVDTARMQEQGGEHFEDVLKNIPNLSWAGASSRPRYFQIRGVGEQEEYQGAPNASVGFIVDDIDLSGIGMAASLFDLDQVEVLRGPQGTRYGANALAGLIYVKSNDPTENFEAGTEVTLGEDDLMALGAYASGSASDTLLYRASLQQTQQNGFRDNLYLGRDDTNERDELTGRLKLRWLASDSLTADLTVLHADLDNGYDAWTLDNNGFDTLTDQPGEDSQTTTGASLKLSWAASSAVSLVSVTSFADTEARHAYDGDWANPDYWSNLQCEDWETGDAVPCQYDYWWDKQQERTTYSQELRLVSGEEGRIFGGTTDWLVGVYAMKLDESNDLQSFYNGWEDVFLKSDYEATNSAIFAQLDSELGEWILSAGLRVEHRSSDYSDDSGEAFSPSETMWGGHLSASRYLADNHLGYVRIARGYKAGGFNMDVPANLPGAKEFDNETLYNYEVGVKSGWLDGALSTNLALFYMDRQDQQVEASTQDPNNPQRFFLYTTNATGSTSYGLEADFSWALTANLELYGSLGLLDASYDDYIYNDKYGTPVDLSGRELAHSPSYQFNLGATYRHDLGWFANLVANGQDSYYYSDSATSNAESDSYVLWNTKIGYEAERWALYLWGRNLTDEKYGVRGFTFGNEPNDGWQEHLYVRYGDPRQFGLTFRYDYF